MESEKTVTGYLSDDHRRLEQIWQDAGHALKGGNSTVAREGFARFDQGLRRHIRIEEEILFPLLEQMGGLNRDFGPTGVMIAEHEAIKGLLVRLRALFGDEAATGGERAARMNELSAMLESHDAKEEMVLYPMADRLATGDERDSLVARMKAVQ